MGCHNCAHGERQTCDNCGATVCEYCSIVKDQLTICSKCLPKTDQPKTLGCGKHAHTPLNKVPISYLIYMQNSDKVSQQTRSIAWAEVKRRRDNAKKRNNKKDNKVQISAETRKEVSGHLFPSDEFLQGE